MNLGEMVTYVQTVLADDAGAFFTPTIVKLFIQRSYVEVYAQIVNQQRDYFVKKATLQYSNNTELYSLASAITPAETKGIVKLVQVTRMDISPKVSIEPIDITEKDSYSAFGGSFPAGDEKYFLVANSIGIAPVPNFTGPAAGNLDIWYIPGPTLPTADGDTLPAELNDMHHELVCQGAIFRGSRRDRDRLEIYAADFNRLWKVLLTDTEKRQTQRSNHIREVDTGY